MKKDRLLLIALIIIIITSSIFGLTQCLLFKSNNKIHIALVGPMSGYDATAGKAMKNGIMIYLDEMNKNEIIKGKKLVLDIYDDQDELELAKEKATKIVNDNRAIAVIGHANSANSHAGGIIYKKHKIPAITPASTNNMINRDNPWYFRIVFNDTVQGNFIAKYIQEVFKEENVSIIYEDNMYGNYLKEILLKKLKKTQVKINNIWKLPSEIEPDNVIEASINQVMEKLKAEADEAGTLVMLTYAYEGIKLVKKIKDLELKNRIIGSDTFAEHEFINGFNWEKRELENPGFYTNGIYVITPLVYDIANVDAQRFKDAYIQKHKSNPDWLAAYAYDAAKLIVETAINQNITASKDTLQNDRQKIQLFLTKLKRDNAIKGITGLNYFNKNGDCPKPVIMGTIQNKEVISVMTQLQPIDNIYEIGFLKEEIIKGNITLIDGSYMFISNVIYTGVDFKKITNINIENLTCDLEFYIWFRWHVRENFDATNIEFLNALEPIKLINPVKQEIRGKMRYRMFHVHGKFAADFLLNDTHSFGQYHNLGVSFINRTITRDNLIYVVDTLGLGVNDTSLMQKQLENHQILNKKTGWKINGTYFFQNIYSSSTLGLPKYLKKQSNLKFSRFNAQIEIERGKWWSQTGSIPIKKIISDQIVMILLVASIAFLFFLTITQYSIFQNSRRWLWVLQLLGWILFLILGKYSITQWLTELNAAQKFLNSVQIFFNLLWWIIPAYLINKAVECFIWNKLEETTKRQIPKIMRHFFGSIIYILAVFGIVAFVFNQKVTGLLAASGVVVMVIGLAIQMNLSNIFSGIAINLESPFKIGDWVVLTEVGEAKVIEITWRSVRLLTRRNTVISVPNSRMAESIIENYNYPDNKYSLGFLIHVDPIHRTNRVIDILKNAVLESKLNSPFVVFKGMTDWSASYWVSGESKDFGLKSTISSTLWTSIKKHLELAGVKPIIQRQEIQLLESNKESSISTEDPFSLLNLIYIFKPLSKEDKMFLSNKAEKIHYYNNETVIKEGNIGKALYMIAEGVLEVHANLNETEKSVVATLGPGHFFGESCLFSEQENSATVITITSSVLYRINKTDIQPLLEAKPELINSFKEIFAHRKTDTKEQVEEQKAIRLKQAQKPKSILRRIAEFIGMVKRK